MSGAPEDNDEVAQRYEGYADYQSVSSAVARSVDRAIESYAALDALHAEGARVRPERAAEARRNILSAALKLVPELESNRDDADEEIYDEILDRWQGNGGPNGEGFFDQLRDVRLQDDCPEWLYQFVQDIRKAGWEIGYLQAGRTVSERDLTEDEAEVRAMFE